MLFAMGLDRNAPPSDVVANAQDGANRTYTLPVEYLGPVPEQDWATAVVLRLDDQMNDPGDVLIGIIYKGVGSCARRHRPRWRWPAGRRRRSADTGNDCAAGPTIGDCRHVVDF
jgi:hypothetical protein